jgi:hypothetical protein
MLTGPHGRVWLAAAALGGEQDVLQRVATAGVDTAAALAAVTELKEEQLAMDPWATPPEAVRLIPQGVGIGADEAGQREVIALGELLVGLGHREFALWAASDGAATLAEAGRLAVLETSHWWPAALELMRRKAAMVDWAVT